MRTPCSTPSPPEFSFEFTYEGAAHNLEVLRRYNFSLGKALQAQQSSPLGNGKEFQPTLILQQIFGLHLLWKRMKDFLKEGSKWPLVDLSEEERQKDLEDALAFGNHKGALQKPELLKKLIGKDVKYGYSLPISLASVRSIPGICMAPMNIMAQNTIERPPDTRPKLEVVVGDFGQLKKELLQACRYGFCIQRLINWTLAARQQYPNQRILASKIDYKSAYRQGILNFATALQTATQLPDNDLAIITLWLTFGGAPCPFKWGIMSETICDLANELLKC
jgi:hypothetical protein